MTNERKNLIKELNKEYGISSKKFPDGSGVCLATVDEIVGKILADRKRRQPPKSATFA